MKIRLAALAAALALTGAVPLAAQRTYDASLVGARVDHLVRAGGGVEQSSGPVFGGRLGTTVSWLELDAHALGGRLTRSKGLGEDRTVGEIGIVASALPLPWLAFNLGGTGRSFTTSLARQRWIAVSTGLEARVQLLEGAVRGSARIAMMPAISVSGQDAPNFAAVTGAAVAYRSRLLTAKLDYSLERFDFPEAGGVRRLEQLGRLSASIGIQFRR